MGRLICRPRAAQTVGGKEDWSLDVSWQEQVPDQQQ